MILLIKPHVFSLTQHPPIGLGYLSAVLSNQGRKTKILDLQFPDHQRELMYYLAYEQISWIGISVSIQNISNTRLLINTITAFLPQIPIVIGGSYPSTLSDHCLNELDVDIAVVGEGEKTILELDAALADNYPLSTVSGLIYREGGEIKKTVPRPLCMNLDILPMPDYEQIPPLLYSRVPWQVFKKGHIVGPILTTRGCPFNCSFCAAASIMGKKLRYRSIKLVGEEMELLHRKFGVDEFHIVDENIASSREHVAAFCEEILRRGLKIFWKTPNGVRSEFLDKDLLHLMKRSGCYMLGFGIESGNPEILKNVDKSLNLESALEKVNMAKQEGIITFGYFMIGLPGDTKETIEQTIQVAINAKFDLAHFSFCIPYPGSHIFSKLDALEQKKLVNRAWHFVPWPQENISVSELSRLHRKAHSMFYMNFSRIWLLVRLSLRSDFFGFCRTIFYYLMHLRIGQASYKPEAIREIAIAKLLSIFIAPIRQIVEGGIDHDLALVNGLSNKINGKVLDIGCGGGLFSHLFSANQYVGIDINRHWLTAARIRNPDKVFLCADYTKRVSMSSTFDMILMSKILYNMDDDGANAIIKQAIELLSPQGIILILEPAPQSRPEHWLRNFTHLIKNRKFYRSIDELKKYFPERLLVRETGIYKKSFTSFYYVVFEKIAS
jgi:radical SAM superfamily enzyme YgiQ (UPF0313 family)/2-polyprenyl-3-methyl-5-hydroxy-6-metoxy-1,4-benzoquinol methylase